MLTYNDQIKNLLERIGFKLDLIKCSLDEAEFGITTLSPPVDPPNDNDPLVLINLTTGVIYYWDGDSWEVYGDEDFYKLGGTTAPLNTDTAYREGNTILGGTSAIKAGDAVLQLDVLGKNSGIDFDTTNGLSYAFRVYNSAFAEPMSYMTNYGAYYSRGWLVISGTDNGGSGYGFSLVHPSSESFMIGILSDVGGPGLQIRASVAAGSYNISSMDSAGNTTFKLEADGTMRWGVGNLAAVDTNLYRYAANILATDGGLKLNGRIDQRFPNGILGNISIGNASGNLSVSGNSNISIGESALTTNTTGSYNISIGTDANTLFTGDNNVAIGHQALSSNVSGANCVAIGFQSLKVNTGAENSAFGNSVLLSNTDGVQNTGIGFASLGSNISGDRNSACGYRALGTTTGNDNTGIGYQSGYGNTGGENTFIGRDAGGSSTGDKNTLLGAYAGNDMAGGGIAIGYGAGYNNTQSNKLFIHNAGGSSEANDKVISIIYGEMDATTANQVLHLNAKVKATHGFNFPTATPASAGAAGTTGDFAWDSTYLYICIAANTWQRVQHATW